MCISNVFIILYDFLTEPAQRIVGFRVVCFAIGFGRWFLLSPQHVECPPEQAELLESVPTRAVNVNNRQSDRETRLICRSMRVNQCAAVTPVETLDAC